MRPEQWETFKRAARREKLDKIPMAMIIDSPWIPGYLGIKHLDYFLDPELWFLPKPFNLSALVAKVREVLDSEANASEQERLE